MVVETRKTNCLTLGMKRSRIVGIHSSDITQ